MFANLTAPKIAFRISDKVTEEIVQKNTLHTRHSDCSVTWEMNEKEASSKRAQIFVAEHHPVAREALSDLLIGDGYRVIQADNATSARSCVEQNKDVAVILADIEMPGWQSFVRHSITAAPKAFTIAMCGADSLVDPAELRKQGIKFWLLKPIVYTELLQALKSRESRR